MSTTLKRPNLEARADYLLELFETTVETYPSGSLLAVGAGSGYNASVFGERFQELHIADVSLRDETDAADHAIQCDGKRLPYPDDSVDVSLAISVIEHVLPLSEQSRLMHELVRVTKPDGYVFVQIPNNRFLIELHTKLPAVQWIPHGERIAARLGWEELRYIRIPGPEELVTWAYAAGGDVLELSPVVYPREAIPAFGAAYDVCERLGIFERCPFGWAITVSPRT